jgi:hypothetical protein
MVHIWLSVTRMTGLAAYMSSMLACGVRGWWCRARGTRGRLFAVLAGVQLVLLLDMAFDWRWKLHGLGVNAAMAYGVYDLRRLPQLLALVVLVAGVVFCCTLILPRFQRRRGAALALIATLLSLGLWWAEALSYHGLDRVLYYMIGKAMLVSFIWIGLGVVTCLGVWIDSRSYPVG